MAIFTILKQDFNVSDEGKNTIEKYIERIERAIIKHKQDNEAKEDIFLRIQEKLEAANQEQGIISTRSIVQIMNDIGEGEDIFRGISENTLEVKQSPGIRGKDVRDFFKREFHRNQKT